MFKKIQVWVSVVLIFGLTSCSVNSETMYYKDAATSMESNVLMDTDMLGMFNMMGNSTDMMKKNSGVDFDQLSTEWKSLYDLQKDGEIVVNDKNAQVLKKMQLKLNKKNNEIAGISMKYDKLLPEEITQLFESNKHLRKIPMQDFGKWDGNKLTIDTEKLNMAEFLTNFEKPEIEKDPKTPRSKSDSVEAYGRQMASGMIGLLKMVNLNYTNRLKFQKPIKSIQGKHDFVKQIDNKTIEITVNTKDLWDEDSALKNKDKKVVIYTE